MLLCPFFVHFLFEVVLSKTCSSLILVEMRLDEEFGDRVSFSSEDKGLLSNILRFITSSSLSILPFKNLRVAFLRGARILGIYV